MAVQYNQDILKINKEFSQSGDVVQIDFCIANKPASVFYIDGFMDKRILEDYILSPLKNISSIDKPFIDTLSKKTIFTTPIETLEKIEDAIKKISEGEIVVVIDEAEGYFVYSEKYIPGRSVVEPPVSSVLRGPREGFIEDIKTNLILIRKRLYSENFKSTLITIGKYTRTKIAVAYIDGIASQKIVDKIIERINSINIDGIIDSGYVARFLEENKGSLFTQVGESEKPDVVVGKMLEGRVAIIVDGSPCVLTLPFLMFEHFQTAEDYYIKSSRSSMLRIIRVLACLMAFILPGFYVAFLEHQYQMLPLRFLNAIIMSSNEIPLTPTLEMLVVLLIFEVLSEASVRMPRYIGMALGVVGAIVLGDVAVSAGLLSSPTILLVAISTVGLYCVPDEVNSMSILRLLFVVIGGVLGVYGLILLSLCVLVYLASLKSYGCAYLTPFAPSTIHDWQDGVLKNEVFNLKERPYSILTKNRTRLKDE